jgi:DNA repair protein RecO (recombination protein O)
VIDRLAANEPMAPALRRFEQCLLGALGYGLDFTREAHTGRLVDTGLWYELRLEEGFARTSARHAAVYSGRELRAVAAGDFSDPATERAARRIFRACLDSLLGPRPLLSRSLIAGMG